MTTAVDDGVVDRDARRLAAWQRRMDPIVIAAAILPIGVALTERGRSEPAVWLDLASWLVFIVDFVVRVRLQPGFWRTRLGTFDLVIVVLTAPWYLLPAFDGARILGLARLGRLGRVFLVSKQGSALHDLGRRLGHAALYSLVLMGCAALVVRAVEPRSSGFDTLGDALWWAMVTFTTVGYGDLFPVTAAGRSVAVMLMVGGIALIGALAGSLGTFFDRATQDEAPDVEPDDAPSEYATLLNEIQTMRAELAELRAAVGDRPGRDTGDAG
jgi:voltage-gated potassium channel